MSRRVTVRELRDAIADAPDDAEIVIKAEGTWAYASTVDVGEVDYSAGPHRPVVRTAIEVTLS